MDFELKTFFRDPPRLKEEVKGHIHALAERMAKQFIALAKMLNLERLLPRHIRVLVFQMCQDPFTIMTRQGLATQQSRVKNTFRLLQRALDDSESRVKTDPKYGGIDKRIVKGVTAILEEHEVRASQAAIVSISACIAEVCGLILNATHQQMNPDQRTMTLENVQSFGTKVCLSNGEKCFNASLARLLHAIDQVEAQNKWERSIRLDVAPSTARPAPSSTTTARPATSDARRREPTAARAERSMRRIEERNVHFNVKSSQRSASEAPRPSTPSDCFWEDD